MRHLLLLFVLPGLLFAQSQHILRITPIGSTPGKIEWVELFANGQHKFSIQAQDSMAGDVGLKWPAAMPALDGQCVVGSTAGVLSFTTCGSGGSGNWVGSGFDSLHTGGKVVLRSGDGSSTLNGAINSSTTSITVADGSGFVSGKHIKIDSEVMLVTSIVGNTLTVTRAQNFTTAASHADGAEVGSAGFIQIEQTAGTHPYRLANGMWYAGAVPYFRPVNNGQGILDVVSNGTHDAWIDVCGTDAEANITSFECLELRTWRTEDGAALNYGSVGMKALGPGTTVRNLAINQSGGYVTLGGNTFSNSLRVQAEAADAKGITIFGTAAPGLEIQNGTDFVYVGLSTGVNKYFPDSVAGNLALRASNGIGFTADAGVTTHLRISAGASRFNTHITTGSPSAFDIGDATNFFQTLFIKNIEGAPAGQTTNYAKFRNLQVADIAGGTAFWEHRAQASGSANSSYTIRDNAGSRWLSASRAVSSSLTNFTSVFTDWIPALRSTGSGDAVTDTTRPSLGAPGSEWTNIYGTNIYGNLTAGTTNSKKLQPDADVTWDLGDPGRNWNVVWARYVEAASGGWIAPQTNNTSSVGRSASRFNKGWFTDLSATGTVQLKSSSVVGQVWTAIDTSGNGGWSTPGTSQWTTSGSNIYFNGGNVTIGGTTPSTRLTVISGTNDGISVGDGIARGIMYASSALTNSIVFGTTSAHPLAVFAGNAQHSVFWPSGNLCVGCSADTYKIEVNGTLHATGLITGAAGATITGTVGATTGFAVSGTPVIDSSRNIGNVVNISNTGAINSTGTITGGNLIANAGIVQAQTGFNMGATNVMDSARNLVNIASATFSGAITANGGISSASGTNSTLYIGSGNFYLRTFSGGNASCSGVTDGWAGIRTDTSELQVCISGSVKKVSLL